MGGGSLDAEGRGAGYTTRDVKCPLVRLKWGERSKMGDLIGVLVDGHPVEG
jgi:hypothetical protein